MKKVTFRINSNFNKKTYQALTFQELAFDLAIANEIDLSDHIDEMNAREYTEEDCKQLIEQELGRNYSIIQFEDDEERGEEE